MCFSNELYIRIIEKHSLLLEDGFPDCGSYESLNVVLNFLEMMNAGHETGRNTGEVFFHTNIHQPWKWPWWSSSTEKYALRAPKEATPDLMRYTGPVWSIYCSLQNIKMNFNCFSNALSSNNLSFPWWKSSKLPFGEVDNAYWSSSEPEIIKANNPIILWPLTLCSLCSLPEEETSPHGLVWLSFF